jgi:hypothetical protein
MSHPGSQEPLDPVKHALGTDVKGVTCHRIQVAQSPDGWEAAVMLDVWSAWSCTRHTTLCGTSLGALRQDNGMW